MTNRNTIDLAIPPVSQSESFRVDLTSGCRDCDGLPKVANAGEICIENGVSVQIMHNGLRVVEGGYYGAWMSEIIKNLYGHHEPQEELMFEEVLKHMGPNATMIELGCFWSYYSLWFLKDHPNRKTLGVEPDPQNRLLGLQNAQLNGLEHEILHGYVGSPEEQTATFPTESSGDIFVPALSPAALILENFGGSLDLLHCDTQGAEIFTALDCSELLQAGKIRFLIVSTHSMHITGDALTHERCLSKLKELGGVILVEHDVQESFSGDGLIVAYFGKENFEFPDIEISRNRSSTSLFRNPAYDLSDNMAHSEEMRLHILTLNAEIERLNADLEAEASKSQSRLGRVLQKLKIL